MDDKKSRFGRVSKKSSTLMSNFFVDPNSSQVQQVPLLIPVNKNQGYNEPIPLSPDNGQKKARKDSRKSSLSNKKSSLSSNFNSNRSNKKSNVSTFKGENFYKQTYFKPLTNFSDTSPKNSGRYGSRIIPMNDIMGQGYDQNGEMCFFTRPVDDLTTPGFSNETNTEETARKRSSDKRGPFHKKFSRYFNRRDDIEKQKRSSQVHNVGITTNNDLKEKLLNAINSKEVGEVNDCQAFCQHSEINSIRDKNGYSPFIQSVLGGDEAIFELVCSSGRVGEKQINEQDVIFF